LSDADKGAIGFILAQELAILTIKCLKWKTPQEIFIGKKPKISHLCVFGCGAYMYLPNEVHTNKLILRSELMIFIGYEDNGYRFIHHT